MAWVVLTPIVLVLATLAVLLGFRHEIVEHQLEKVLRTPIVFNDVSLDFVSDFPNTVLILDDVHILGTNPAKPSELLRAEEAELRIDLFKLLTNRTERDIKLISIRRGELFLEVDEKGVRNFGLFGKYNPNSKKGPDLVLIRALDFEEMDLRYHNHTMDRQESYHFDNIATALNIRRKDLTIDLLAQGRCDYIHIGDFSIFENKSLYIKTQMTSDKQTCMMDFAPSTVRIGAANLQVEGQLQMGERQYYSLRFKTVGGSLDAIKSLLPSKTEAQLRDFDAMGAMSVSGSFIGYQTADSYPHFDLQFRFDDATLRNRQTGFDINGLKLVGSYSNGEANNITTTALRIDTLLGNFGDRPFYGRVALSRFNDLLVDGAFISKLNLKEVSEFFGNRLGTGFEGEVDVNIRFDGAISQLKQRDSVDQLHYDGAIILSHIRAPLLNGGLLLEDISGSVRLHETNITVQDLGGKINQQPVAVTGQISDFIPYLIGNKGVLSASFQVSTTSFDVERFLAPLPDPDSVPAPKALPPSLTGLGKVGPMIGAKPPKSPKQPKAPKPQKGSAEAREQALKMLRQVVGMSFPERLDLKLEVYVDGLRFRELQLDEAYAQFRLDGQGLYCDTLLARTDDDTLAVGFRVLTADAGQNQFRLQTQVGTGNLIQFMQSLRLPTDKLPKDLNLNAGARLEVEGWVEKTADSTCTPAMHIRVQLSDAHFIRHNARIALHDLGFVAYLDERHVFDPKNAPLQLLGIGGRANDYPFVASFAVDNWVEQNAALSVSTNISLPVFLTYFKEIAFLDSLQGHMYVDATLKGKLSHFTNFDSLITLSNTGQVAIKGMKFRLKVNQLAFRDIEVQVDYDDQGVSLQYMTGHVGSSDVAVSGYMRDVLSYLFKKDAPLIAKVDIRSDSLHVKELFAADASRPESALKLTLPTHSDLEANLNIGYAHFDSIEVHNLTTRMLLQDRYLKLDTLSFDAFGGSVRADGSLDAADTSAIALQGHVELLEIDVRDFFHRFGNFGQTFLTDTMMRGTLTAAVTANHTMTASFKPKPADLQFTADLYLHDGALYGFRPLLKLKPLFRVADLDSIQFGVAVRGAVFNGAYLNLPDVVVMSNLLLAEANGFHFLDNTFTYNVVVHKMAPHLRHMPLVSYEPHLAKLAVSPWRFVLARQGGKLRVKYDFKNLAQQLLP